MKNIFLLVVAAYAVLACTLIQANTERSSLDEALFLSIVENNFDKFEEALESGADPNAMTDGRYYISSALCEATKPENDKYLNTIYKVASDLEFQHSTVLFSSQANCAIGYRNMAALEKLISVGLDVEEILNPDVQEELQKTLLDFALSTGNMDIVWEIMQIAEPNERQIKRLVQSVEYSGGYEGHRYVPYIRNIADWLIEKNIEVNPRPPFPVQKAIKR